RGEGAELERRAEAAHRDRARAVASPLAAAARRTHGRAGYREPLLSAGPCARAAPRARPFGAFGHAPHRRGGARRPYRRASPRPRSGRRPRRRDRFVDWRARFAPSVPGAHRGRGVTALAYWHAFAGILRREALRFLHQRGRFIAALVRPLVWLLIFAA